MCEMKGIFVMTGLNGEITGVMPPANGEYYTIEEFDELFEKGYSFIPCDRYPVKD